MEPAELYRHKVDTLKIAIQGFRHLLLRNLDGFDPEMVDAIKNGQVQKFEYCTELLWKTIKHNLSFLHGIDEVSPKSVMKAFFRTNNLSQDLYESLILMIDHRNTFSHVYNEQEFNELYSYLKKHGETMSTALSHLTGSTTPA